MGITLFTTAKPFLKLSAIHQRNALRSWTKLPGDWELILIGDDQGSREFAQEHGFIHHPKVATTDSGTPLVNDLFRIARESASYPTIAYANADIILLADAARLVSFFEEYSENGNTLLTSRRKELILDEALAFDDPDWEVSLKNRIESQGCPDAETALDLFAFNKERFTELPPFAIGRPGWDNWLLAHAANQNLQIIDASHAVTLVHPAHDYGHVAGGWIQAWHGEEARRNRTLLDGPLTTLSKATNASLFPEGLRDGYFPIESDPKQKAKFKLKLAARSYEQGDATAACYCCIEALSLSGYAIADCPDFARFPQLLETLNALFTGNRTPSLEQVAKETIYVFGEWIRTLLNSASKSQLAIWGTGRAGHSMRDCLEAAELALDFYVDSDQQKWDAEIDGVQVHAPQDVFDSVTTQRPFILIASMYRAEIESSLTHNGLQRLRDFA